MSKEEINQRLKNNLIGKTKIISLLDRLNHKEKKSYDELADLLEARDPYLLENDKIIRFICDGIRNRGFKKGRSSVPQGTKNIAIIAVLEALYEGYGAHLSNTNIGAYEAASLKLKERGLNLTKDKIRNYWDDRDNSDMSEIFARRLSQLKEKKAILKTDA